MAPITGKRHKIKQLDYTKRLLDKGKIFTCITAHKLVKEYDLIAVEDLNIKGLGRNTKLSKSIYDLAWGTFIEKLSAVVVKRGVSALRFHHS